MAYCNHSDVGKKTAVTYTDTTQPTRDEVTSVTARISHEIDGVLRAAGYGLPVTDSDDLELLNYYATLGSSYNAWHEGFVVDTAPDRVKSWEKDYRDFLARLRRGEQTLNGQSEPEKLRSWSSVPLVRADGYAEEAEDSDYA